MNPAAILLGIAAAFVAAGIAVAAARKAPWLSPNDRVWVLGDSLGVGLLPQFIALGGQHGIPVAGNPVGGTIVRQWAQKDLSVISLWGATAALVVLGSNDAASSEAYVQGELAGDAQALIANLHKLGVKVWWLMPGETGALPHSAEVRAIVSGVAAANGVAAMPAPGDTTYSKRDYVHPTPAGYVQLAAWVWGQWSQ